MMLSFIHEKVPLKWPQKTLKKVLLKRTKNMKLSRLFSNFRGINHPSYQLFRPLLNSQFFLSFNFYFGHKILCGLKT